VLEMEIHRHQEVKEITGMDLLEPVNILNNLITLINNLNTWH
jgi:hypothetical protein